MAIFEIISQPRRQVIRTFTRVNQRIRVPQVRCISETGEQIGVITTAEALRRAESRGLDLVEISPNADPPVCRIMNFGKYRYEESQREKLARKHQATVSLKETKFHMNVEEHDYQTKLNHIREFLTKGHRVKASLLFRGRENEHRELGYNLMTRLAKDCENLGAPESSPRLFGNNLVIMLHPQHGKKREASKPVVPQQRADQKPVAAQQPAQPGVQNTPPATA